MAAGRKTTKLRYGVFLQEDQWRLSCQEYQLARFETLTDAVAAGRRAACQAIGSGFDAELLIIDATGELRRAGPASIGH